MPLHHALRRASAMRAAVLACALLLALVLAGQARADGASTQTLIGQSSGATSATLAGYVITGGSPTGYFFAYAPAGSPWCTSSGASGAASDTPTATATSDGQVSAVVTGLTAGQTYCDALELAGATGAPTGAIQTVTVGLPVADSDSAASTGQGTATVTGDVQPSGQTTSYDVGYDLDGSPWCLSAGTSGAPSFTTPPESLDPSQGDDQTVSVDLTELTAGNEYCAALQADNGSGAAQGVTIDFLQGTAAVALTTTTVTGDTSVAIDGQIASAGQATSYAVEFDTADSDWCESNGLSGLPAVGPVSSLPSDGAVEVDLSGLTAGTAYCAELEATNASATVVSTMATFSTTGTASSGPVTIPGTSSAPTTTMGSGSSVATTTTSTTASATATTTPASAPAAARTGAGGRPAAPVTTGAAHAPSSTASAPVVTPARSTPTRASGQSRSTRARHGHHRRPRRHARSRRRQRRARR